MEDNATYGKKNILNNTTSALKGGGIIGIDFGATNLRAALVSEHGLTHLASSPTPSQGTWQDVWQALADLIRSIVLKNNGQLPTAICVGVPSVVDTATGTVFDIQHIPSCKSLPLGSLIENKFDVLTLINNDANAFALGEYYFGNYCQNGPHSKTGFSPSHKFSNTRSGRNVPDQEPAMKSYKEAMASHIKAAQVGPSPANSLNSGSDKQASSLVGLTIGTGLGAGLILNGKLYSGPNCGAGEIGCFPYLDGNLERYVSGAFFNNDSLDGKGYFELAQKGDKTALVRYQQFGYHLGQAIKIIMYAYDPDFIILGGSVSNAFNFFAKSMSTAMQDFDYPGILTKIKIYPSKLKYSAILGAASLYFDYVKN